jgi:hypothetical protein
MNKLLDILRNVNLIRCFVLVVVITLAALLYRSALRSLTEPILSRLPIRRLEPIPRIPHLEYSNLSFPFYYHNLTTLDTLSLLVEIIL